MKTCSECFVDKPATVEFFYRRRASSEELRARCKECMSVAETRAWTKKKARLASDPEFAAAYRAWHRKQRDVLYGLSPGEHDEMLRQQQGRCASCGRLPEETTSDLPLHVDHNHVTGAVRGLLCHNCNLALGHVGDSVDRLMQLAAYLLQQESVLELTK